MAEISGNTGMPRRRTIEACFRYSASNGINIQTLISSRRCWEFVPEIESKADDAMRPQHLDDVPEASCGILPERLTGALPRPIPDESLNEVEERHRIPEAFACGRRTVSPAFECPGDIRPERVLLAISVDMAADHIGGELRTLPESLVVVGLSHKEEATPPS